MQGAEREVWRVLATSLTHFFMAWQCGTHICMLLLCWLQVTQRVDRLGLEWTPPMVLNPQPPLAQRRVLAFAPEVLPLNLATEAEVRTALMGLAQVCAPASLPSLTTLVPAVS